MKRFILKRDGKDKGTDSVYPDLNPENIPSQYALNRTQNYFSTFLPDDTSFKGMIPEYIGDNPPKQVHTICDMHDFIRKKPYAQVYSVSKRFKELLEKFTIPNTKFYEGSVVWNEKEYPYFVWHILTQQFSFVDFEKSLFCDTNYFSKDAIGTEYYKVSDFSKLYPLKKEKKWDMWGFYRAVMKPEFREVDVYEMDYYGIVISERLKEAIESAQLTNVSITPCPIEFEISDQI
ncbi:hypothetical protein QNI16_20855 [Cytophagaceae bacterium YF14B1]|uniref:Uncharacterized protein n=2 Tax=Xanthocytophaga flava TaxID=3048013 RepID=A0AAE3QTJ0_9BACT|nr:hypothetical protein [Xanthocytophaga flavus]